MLHTGSNFYDSTNLALNRLISKQQLRATIGLFGLMAVVPGLRPAVVEVNSDRSGRWVLTPWPVRHISQLCCQMNPRLVLIFGQVWARCSCQYQVCRFTNWSAVLLSLWKNTGATDSQGNVHIWFVFLQQIYFMFERDCTGLRAAW